MLLMHMAVMIRLAGTTSAAAVESGCAERPDWTVHVEVDASVWRELPRRCRRPSTWIRSSTRGHRRLFDRFIRAAASAEGTGSSRRVLRRLS